MKLTLMPSAQLRLVDGVVCRIWCGHTETGIPVEAAIRYCSPQTHDPAVNAQFARELIEIPEPSEHRQAGGPI